MVLTAHPQCIVGHWITWSFNTQPLSTCCVPSRLGTGSTEVNKTSGSLPYRRAHVIWQGRQMGRFQGAGCLPVTGGGTGPAGWAAG